MGTRRLAWCSPLQGSLRGIPEGSEVSVLLRDGRVIVGTLRSVGSLSVVLLPVGRERQLRLPRPSVRSARLVAGHTWAERQSVASAQRSGDWLVAADFTKRGRTGDAKKGKDE